MALKQKTVYFREEDLPKWEAIGNKAEWLHDHLNPTFTATPDAKKAFIDPLIKTEGGKATDEEEIVGLYSEPIEGMRAEKIPGMRLPKIVGPKPRVEVNPKSHTYTNFLDKKKGTRK